MFRAALVLLSLVLLASGVLAQDAADTAAQTRLQKVFGHVEGLRTARVTMRDGVVKLTGTAASDELRVRAAKLAANMEGVLFVDNDLKVEVEGDIADQLLPSLDRWYSSVRNFIAQLPLFVAGVIVFFVFFWLSGVVSRRESLFKRVVRSPLLRDLIRQSTRAAIVLLGLYLALEMAGATALVGAVLGTVGLVGLALGFAFRGIVENYLASILLSLRRPFDARDLVEIDGVTGLVIRLTSTDTILLTPDGNHVRIPNASVFHSRVMNYTRNPLRRFDFVVGVGAEEDLTRAQKIGIGVLEAMPGVIDDPEPAARVEALGDSSVSVRYYGWVDQTKADFGKVKSEAVRLVKVACDDAGVDMPVPTYAVNLSRERDEEATKPAPREPRSVDIAEIDVSVEDDLERQVAADEAKSEEGNLLDE